MESLLRSRRTFLKATAGAVAVPFAVGGTARHAEAAPARVFYVAPSGDDTGPGTAGRPFRTPQRARDAVRAFKQHHPVGDITVYFREGTYTLTETLVFCVADSGNPRQTITYMAYPGETATFSSAVPVRDWRPVTTPPPGLPNEAVGKVWAADIPAGSCFKALFEDGRMLPAARSRGFFPTRSFSPAESQTPEHLNTLCYPAELSPGLAGLWDEVTDIEVLIMPTVNWMVNILPLASIDHANLVATTQVPGRSALGRATAAASAWFQNAIGFLDTPGEWVVNSREGQVIFWPQSGEPRDVRVPVLQQLIRVEGDIDRPGPADRPVTHLVFRGLSFTGGERDTWPADYRGRDIQHAWDLHDRDNALVQFRGVEDSAILECAFAHTGHNAIRCDLHCQRIRVIGNSIHDVGGTGIIFAGYGPGTKDVNKHNRVQNNEIYRTGRLYWHGLGIWIWQSGQNVVANNRVHSTPYTGVAVSGRIAFNRTDVEREGAATVRWPDIDPLLGSGSSYAYHLIEPFLHTRDNIVEQNDISDVMASPLQNAHGLRDGNGIYVSGAAHGNVVRRNYIHDIPSPRLQAAYRTDDAQFETLFTENVICRTGGHFGMVLKQRNHMTNNVVADLIDPDIAYLAMIIGPVEGSVLQRNIYYSAQVGQRVLQEGPSYNGIHPQLIQTASDFNTYHSTIDASWGPSHLQAHQPLVDQHSVAADPLFYDAGRRDFRLRPGSPSLAAGFAQIDMMPMGLNADFAYANPDDLLDRVFVRSGDQFASLDMNRGTLAALRVAGRTVSGYQANLRNALIRFASDNLSVAVVAPLGGLVLAVWPGVAEITVTVTTRGVTKTTTIVVLVR